MGPIRPVKKRGIRKHRPITYRVDEREGASMAPLDPRMRRLTLIVLIIFMALLLTTLVRAQDWEDAVRIAGMIANLHRMDAGIEAIPQLEPLSKAADTYAGIMANKGWHSHDFLTWPEKHDIIMWASPSNSWLRANLNKLHITEIVNSFWAPESMDVFVLATAMVNRFQVSSDHWAAVMHPDNVAMGWGFAHEKKVLYVVAYFVATTAVAVEENQ